jgi:signal transduction histidine kinase
MINSIQAIESEGKILVELKLEGTCAAIAVVDTGRGIPPDHLPNIFRPFYTTKGNGTGLGLSLARRIVEEHGGRIDVASSVGEGTRFVVSLPIVRTDSESAAASQAKIP